MRSLIGRRRDDPHSNVINALSSNIKKACKTKRWGAEQRHIVQVKMVAAAQQLKEKGYSQDDINSIIEKAGQRVGGYGPHVAAQLVSQPGGPQQAPSERVANETGHVSEFVAKSIINKLLDDQPHEPSAIVHSVIKEHNIRDQSGIAQVQSLTDNLASQRDSLRQSMQQHQGESNPQRSIQSTLENKGFHSAVAEVASECIAEKLQSLQQAPRPT